MSGILNMYSIGHVARQAPCVLLHALWWSAVSNCQRAYHAGVMTAAQAAVLPPVEAFTFAPVPPNAPTVTYAVAAAGTAAAVPAVQPVHCCPSPLWRQKRRRVQPPCCHCRPCSQRMQPHQLQLLCHSQLALLQQRLRAAQLSLVLKGRLLPPDSLAEH